MMRRVASTTTVSIEAERAIASLRHLLEVRRELLAERRLHIAKWRALLATSRALLAEPTLAPSGMARAHRLLIRLPGSPDSQRKPNVVHGILEPNEPQRGIGHAVADDGAPFLQRASGL